MATPDFDHEQREEQEEHGHPEANAVNRLVANQHITVHMTLHTRNRRTHPSFTETWNLQQHRAEVMTLHHQINKYLHETIISGDDNRDYDSTNMQLTFVNYV